MFSGRMPCIYLSTGCRNVFVEALNTFFNFTIFGDFSIFARSLHRECLISKFEQIEPIICFLDGNFSKNRQEKWTLFGSLQFDKLSKLFIYSCCKFPSEDSVISFVCYDLFQNVAREFHVIHFVLLRNVFKMYLNVHELYRNT